MDFGSEVIAWYLVNKRDLPWRDTRDPYLIWLSEVILQQTRVEQGLPYFYRFSEAYPEVSDLAAASQEEVLKLWQGLGYYSRGRNMHYTAKEVMAQHGGSFPVSYEQLVRLKGIGEYTASAVSSFAAGEARAVVDGNVFRLLSRFFGIGTAINSTQGRKEFAALARELLGEHPSGIFNQAIMEFGSLQCRPRNPACGICPVRSGCSAYASGRVGELPVKLKKTAVRNRYFNYIIADTGRGLLVNKRGEGDIWQNLYDFPLIETEAPVAAELLIRRSTFTSLFGENVTVAGVSGPVKHILSHQKLHAVFIRIADFEERFLSEKSWFYANSTQLSALPQPKLIFAFLKNYTHFHF
jgi:A/G-specific adenine glycosylase